MVDYSFNVKATHKNCPISGITSHPQIFFNTTDSCQFPFHRKSLKKKTHDMSHSNHGYQSIGSPIYSLAEQLNTTNTTIPLGLKSAFALIPPVSDMPACSSNTMAALYC